MKKITQQNNLLSLIENLVRSNIYLFIFFRYLTNKFFAKLIYETDFKILFYLKNFKFFSKSIIDIGANDGISIKAIRKFVKNKIYSFEPNKINYKKISKLKTRMRTLVTYNYGLSNKSTNKIYIYEAHYKKYHLSPFDSLLKKNVIKHLKSSLFIKNIINKVKIRKSLIKLKKLDDFKLSPSFIKIDVQGHEFECIIGALKTINKYRPIIMIEFDKKIINKIDKRLKKIGYLKFYFKADKIMLIKHKNEKVFNIIFIHNSLISKINKKIKFIAN